MFQFATRWGFKNELHDGVVQLMWGYLAASSPLSQNPWHVVLTTCGLGPLTWGVLSESISSQFLLSVWGVPISYLISAWPKMLVTSLIIRTLNISHYFNLSICAQIIIIAIYKTHPTQFPLTNEHKSDIYHYQINSLLFVDLLLLPSNVRSSVRDNHAGFVKLIVTAYSIIDLGQHWLLMPALMFP